MKIHIDPTKMKGNQSIILDQLLDPLTDAGTSGSYQVIPNHPIRKRVSKDESQIATFEVFIDYRKKKKITIDELVLPYEIIKEDDTHFRVVKKQIGRGGQGGVYDVGTLVRRNGKLIFKEAPQAQHERVMKRLYVKTEQHQQEAVIEQKELEVFDKKKKLYADFPHLHAKVSMHKQKMGAGTDTSINVTMHRATGEPLDKILKDKKLSAPLQFELTRKLLQALKEQIHDKGYIHNDIKPGNIIADIDFEVGIVRSVTIIDVDTARKIDQPGQVKGTTQYMAPELFDHTNGVPQSTLQSDLYSLSIVLARIWGGNKDKLERKNPLDNTFHPDFSLDLDINYKDKIEPLLQAMGSQDPKERGDLDAWIEKFDVLEKEYILGPFQEDKEQNTAAYDQVASAYDEGKAAKNGLQQCDQFESSEEYFNHVRSVIDKHFSFSEIDAIDEEFNSSAINAFTKMLDVNAVRPCEDKSDLHKKLDDIALAFMINQRKIALMHESFTHNDNKQDVTIRLSKKLKKCKTVDDCDAFNQHLSEQINELYESTFPISMRKKHAIKDLKKEVENSESIIDLQRVHRKLVSDHYLFLKEETNIAMKLFGQHGITNSWSLLITELQKKSIRFF